ncbi:MAG: hypothetical protein LBD17_05645 [Endomicrobium sp.]|jgi:hypothetical protein|nr:hypothetical protein [Endomicrobium sp.]
MTSELKPILKVYLIDLLSRGGTILLRDFTNPSYKADKKSELIKLNLVSEQKVPQLRGGQKISEISITQQGWSYLSNNLDFPHKSGSKSVPIIFDRLLKEISGKLKSKNITIDKLFEAKTIHEPAITHEPALKHEPALTSDQLLKHIQKIHREQKSLLMPGGGLKIAKLWGTLDGIPLDKLRELLIELQKQEHLVVYRFDDPGMIEPEDKKAEFLIGGEARHYIFLKSYH